MVPYDLRVANNTFTFTLSKKFSKKKKKKKKKKKERKKGKLLTCTKHAYKMIRLKSEINYAARA